MITNGAKSRAALALVQYASRIVELSTYGKEFLMSTAWTAVIREEIAPYARATVDAEDPEASSVEAVTFAGAMPTKKPMVTMPAASKTNVVGLFLVVAAETAIVNGRTRPRAIFETRISLFPYRAIEEIVT
jgi:hypothetical protein